MFDVRRYEINVSFIWTIMAGEEAYNKAQHSEAPPSFVENPGILKAELQMKGQTNRK